MTKDKQRWLLLGALALLFFVLTGSNFHLGSGGFRLFHNGPWTTLVVLALVWWLICGRNSCCGSGCGKSDAPVSDEADVESTVGGA